jgi:hypothetical protein
MLPKKFSDEKSAHLDPFHSHFILVDSVKLNDFGGEVKYRSDIEEAICKRSPIKNMMATMGSEMKIPIVTLVLGGGRNTVKQILSSIQKGIPCVIFDVKKKKRKQILKLLFLVKFFKVIL